MKLLLKPIFYGQVICILSLLIPITMLGQKYSYGLYITPTIGYRVFSKDFNYLEKYHSKASLFNAGIFIKRALSKRVAINAGLDYSVAGYNANAVFHNPFRYFATDKYELNYLGIPVLINLKALQYRKFSLSISSGIINKFLLFAHYNPYNILSPVMYFGNGDLDLTKPTTVKYNYSKLKDMGYNMFIPEIIGSVDFNYALGNYSISLAPEIRYALKTTTKQLTYYHLPYEHLYTYGLKFIFSKN